MPEEPKKTTCSIGLLAHVDAGGGAPRKVPKKQCIPDLMAGDAICFGNNLCIPDTREGMGDKVSEVHFISSDLGADGGTADVQNLHFHGCLFHLGDTTLDGIRLSVVSLSQPDRTGMGLPQNIPSAADPKFIFCAIPESKDR